MEKERIGITEIRRFHFLCQLWLELVSYRIIELKDGEDTTDQMLQFAADNYYADLEEYFNKLNEKDPDGHWPTTIKPE